MYLSLACSTTRARRLPGPSSNSTVFSVDRVKRQNANAAGGGAGGLVDLLVRMRSGAQITRTAT